MRNITAEFEPFIVRKLADIKVCVVVVVDVVVVDPSNFKRRHTDSGLFSFRSPITTRPKKH